jgi:macrolide-specific efflux system membrane fusion protein
MAGTVVSQSAREGQTLNANQTAPIVVQVANLNTMTVRAQVAEADVMRLKPGIEVYFTTLGSQERTWYGKVQQIEPSPEILNDVVLYNALIDVKNTDRQLMTGMSTQVFFIIGKAEGVAVIPARVLGKRLAEQDNAQGQAYQVKVQRDGKGEETTVHVGLMTRNLAEIRAGLQVGDEVVLAMPSPDKPASTSGQRPRMTRGPSL